MSPLRRERHPSGFFFFLLAVAYWLIACALPAAKYDTDCINNAALWAVKSTNSWCFCTMPARSADRANTRLKASADAAVSYQIWYPRMNVSFVTVYYSEIKHWHASYTYQSMFPTRVKVAGWDSLSCAASVVAFTVATGSNMYGCTENSFRLSQFAILTATTRFQQINTALPAGERSLLSSPSWQWCHGASTNHSGGETRDGGRGACCLFSAK